MTSNISTFPYSVPETAQFLKLIRPYQGKKVDGHIRKTEYLLFLLEKARKAGISGEKHNKHRS